LNISTPTEHQVLEFYEISHPKNPVKAMMGPFVPKIFSWYSSPTGKTFLMAKQINGAAVIFDLANPKAYFRPSENFGEPSNPNGAFFSDKLGSTYVGLTENYYPAVNGNDIYTYDITKETNSGLNDKQVLGLAIDLQSYTMKMWEAGSDGRAFTVVQHRNDDPNVRLGIYNMQNPNVRLPLASQSGKITNLKWYASPKGKVYLAVEYDFAKLDVWDMDNLDEPIRIASTKWAVGFDLHWYTTSRGQDFLAADNGSVFVLDLSHHTGLNEIKNPEAETPGYKSVSAEHPGYTNVWNENPVNGKTVFIYQTTPNQYKIVDVTNPASVTTLPLQLVHAARLPPAWHNYQNGNMALVTIGLDKTLTKVVLAPNLDTGASSFTLSDDSRGFLWVDPAANGDDQAISFSAKGYEVLDLGK